MSFKNREEAHRFMKKNGIPIPTKEEGEKILRGYPHMYIKSVCPICNKEIWQFEWDICPQKREEYYELQKKSTKAQTGFTEQT